MTVGIISFQPWPFHVLSTHHSFGFWVFGRYEKVGQKSVRFVGVDADDQANAALSEISGNGRVWRNGSPGGRQDTWELLFEGTMFGV